MPAPKARAVLGTARVMSMRVCDHLQLLQQTVGEKMGDVLEIPARD